MEICKRLKKGENWKVERYIANTCWIIRGLLYKNVVWKNCLRFSPVPVIQSEWRRCWSLSEWFFHLMFSQLSFRKSSSVSQPISSSDLELIPKKDKLTLKLCLISMALLKSKSPYDRWSVGLGAKPQLGAQDQIFVFVVQLAVLSMWAALSDERMNMALMFT
jgi:hypothetical protein